MANPLQNDLEYVFGRTEDVWEAMRGGRVFITGGTGFFGCWLLESFCHACERLNLGAEAVVLTRDVDAFRKKAPHLAGSDHVKLYRGDVKNFEFPTGMFSHVLHAATEAVIPKSAGDWLRMFDTIVDGTRRTLDFAVRSGAKRFLLTSSGAVYGRQPSELVNVGEDYLGAPDPMVANSAYGEGKRVAELLCSLYHQAHGLQTTIARCFAFVGPYLPLDAHFAVGNFVRDALSGTPIQVLGDGTAQRSYMYAADLAVWLWKILIYGTPCVPYNVGSEESVSIGAVAELVASRANPRVPVNIHRSVDPARPVERYVPATKRAAAELRLDGGIAVDEAIERTLVFHRSQRLESTTARRPSENG